MSYVASPIKRTRATADEMGERREALSDIVFAGRPMTVRQVFYQATIAGIVEKTEAGYAKVQRALVEMRHSGEIKWEWIADNTRWQRRLTTFSSPEEALRETARFYRKALWVDANDYVEVWLEKDALSGVLTPITYEFDVPLMVTRGYSSVTFLWNAGSAIQAIGKPAYIYQIGDHDPSGVDAARKIEEGLREFAHGVPIHFERIAVTPSQIKDWRLPSRPTKTTDTRSKGFDGESVEVDAIEPGKLRDLVQTAIERHMPTHQYQLLKAAEESEREGLLALHGGKSA